MSIFFKLFLMIAICITANASKKKKPWQPKIKHNWELFTGPKPTVTKSSNTDSIIRGKKLYQSHCLKCHGVSGKGDGEEARKLKIKPTNLIEATQMAPNYYLVMQINQGKGSMPQWENILTAKESWDVTNYIKSLYKQK